ncbi:hypothetical protein VNO77_43492 [Canavalia gladiata]|uniref:SUI1 domain-containing protein n=1 Tax=Canavalia gladiata TaxID=3824 RepID=A0AAN9PPG2_CANGL
MEKKDVERRSQCEPCHQAVININDSNVRLVGSAKKIDNSFNNEGDGDQSFEHAAILGSSSSGNSMIPNNRTFHPTNMSYGHYLGPHRNLQPYNNFGPSPPPPPIVDNHGHQFDPYDEEDSDSSNSTSDSSSWDSDVEDSHVGARKYVDVYLEYQRSRKYVTIVQGLKPGNGLYARILNSLKMEFNCEGYFAHDEDFGWVIKLYGDRVKIVCNFLVRTGLVEREYMRIHRL